MCVCVYVLITTLCLDMRSALFFCVFLIFTEYICVWVSVSLYMLYVLYIKPFPCVYAREIGVFACTVFVCVCPCAVCVLTCSCMYARHVERHHQGSGEDSEAGNHVPRGLPGGGSDHEETPPRQAGAALRRRV